MCFTATKKQIAPAEQNAPIAAKPPSTIQLRGAACHSIAAEPARIITTPEKNTRLSGDSVRVNTRDHTMFTEKQLTHTMQAANPIQSPGLVIPKGFTAITTPAERTICLAYAVIDVLAYMIEQHPEAVEAWVQTGWDVLGSLAPQRA